MVCVAVLALLPEYVSTRRADAWGVGDLFVGVGSPGWNPGRIAVYDRAGNPRSNIQIPRADAGYATGCYYNPDSQTLFATTFSANAIHEFDGTRSIRRTDVSTLGAGVVAVESIAFNPQGDRFYVGLPWSAPQMASYAYSQVTGASNPQSYSVSPGVDRATARADWVDVAVEGNETVVYYTDESAYDGNNSTPVSRVYRYVPSSGLRTVFAVVPEAKAYALRLLPRGGGMLVAAHAHIYRFDMQGTEVFRYNVVGGGSFFALNITPDGRYFWTATADVENPGVSGWLHKFNITASRQPVLSVNTGAPVVSGLCVKHEYTAARNVCSDESTGQPVTCPRLEVCTEGPDDDGDGLDDLNDPDCALPGTKEVCDDPEGADENRNGILNDCPRSTPERSQVSVSFASRPVNGETITYSATGLPSNLTMSSSGLVTGTTTDGATGNFTVTVSADRSAYADTTATFVWTVTDVNRAPVVAGVQPQSATEGEPYALQVSASDPDTSTDGDGLTFAAAGLPAGLSINPITGLISGVPLAGSAGSYAVVVTVTDDHGARSTPTRPLDGSKATTMSFSIDVRKRAGNQPPICALAAPSIGQIWPPNHKLVEVGILGVTDPEGDPVVIQIGGIHQDEPTNTQGDGNTSIDGAISADRTKAFVRAERIGVPQAPGDGRVYEILFTATAGGQSCTGMVRVGVPHDQGGMPVPVRSPATYNSLTGARIN